MIEAIERRDVRVFLTCPRSTRPAAVSGMPGTATAGRRSGTRSSRVPLPVPRRRVSAASASTRLSSEESPDGPRRLLSRARPMSRPGVDEESVGLCRPPRIVCPLPRPIPEPGCRPSRRRAAIRPHRRWPLSLWRPPSSACRLRMTTPMTRPTRTAPTTGLYPCGGRRLPHPPAGGMSRWMPPGGHSQGDDPPAERRRRDRSGGPGLHQSDAAPGRCLKC
jgi:hypothetical protein